MAESKTIESLLSVDIFEELIYPYLSLIDLGALCCVNHGFGDSVHAYLRSIKIVNFDNAKYITEFAFRRIIANIQHCRKLILRGGGEKFNIHPTEIVDAIHRNKPLLTDVTISGCFYEKFTQIDDSWFETFVQRCNWITHLSLAWCKHVTIKDFDQLATLWTNLELLDVSATHSLRDVDIINLAMKATK